MNERGIVDYLRLRLGKIGIELSPDESLAVVGVFCEAILAGLLKDGKCSIPTFGEFQAKERDVAINFRSLPTTRMKCVSFKPSRGFLTIFRSLNSSGLDFKNLQEGWWLEKGESGIKSGKLSSPDRLL